MYLSMYCQPVLPAKSVCAQLIETRSAGDADAREHAVAASVTPLLVLIPWYVMSIIPSSTASESSTKCESSAHSLTA